MMKEKKKGFNSRIGFIFAAASSAVGLGNLWRFPYLAAQYGGGIFLLVYLILAVTFGFAMMITEIGIGRKTGKTCLSAFRSLDERFAFCGVLGTVIPFIITPYYCLIGGWVTKYAFTFLTQSVPSFSNDVYFTEYISKAGEPLIFLLIFLACASFVVVRGVQDGIEKASIFLMPTLIALSILIALYTVTRPGAMGGVVYYLKPDFSKLTAKTVLAAIGQLFYSMSLAMGIMITYGSYMKKEDNLEQSVRQIEIFDTLIAFIAGLMIIPAVYVFSGGDSSAMGAGPGLMFITLPKVFNTLPMGRVFGFVFFILVFFAALTSAISLIETLVSIIQERFSTERVKTTLIVAVYTFLFAVPSSLGFGVLSGIQPLNMSILDFCDFASNSVLMPIMAFFTCVLVGFVLKPQVIIDEVERNGNEFKAEKLYVFVVKWIAPIGLAAILISSVLAGLGLMSW